MVYLERFDPIAATQVGGRLFALGESLSTFPNRGRPAGDRERELVTVPPYILRYAVRAEVVTILDIRHGARLPRAGGRAL